MPAVFVWKPQYTPAPARMGRGQALVHHGNAQATLPVAFDVAEDKEAYIVQAQLPGMNPNDIEINLENQVLTVKGEYPRTEPAEGVRYHLRERKAGRFERSFRFRLPLDAAQVEARYEQGILHLRLPKVAAVQPRRIEVQVDTPVMAS